MASVRPAPCRTANHFGLEVNQCLIWKGWEPGKEYTKNIVLKNVNSKKTKKVEFTFPRNVSFKTLFPQQIVLSAGTSTSLPVTFRPIDSKVYEDKITLKTPEGELVVPVRAILPRPKLEVPTSVDFGMCACANQNKKQFEIQNSGDLDLEFNWVVPEPFSLTPNSGIIGAKSKLVVDATFLPTIGVVFETDAVCRYRVPAEKAEEQPDEESKKKEKGKTGEEEAKKDDLVTTKKPEEAEKFTEWKSKSIAFLGIGKFVHLVPSLDPAPPALTGGASDGEALLDFGSGVAPGQRLERFVFLHNLSPVEAPFSVEQPSGKGRIDAAFVCPVASGVVPPLSTARLPIVFRPATRDSTFVDSFRVSASASASSAVVSCVGGTIGARVTLSVAALTFNLVRLPDGVATMPFLVANEGETEAVFQFAIESEQSAFKFDQTSGVIPAKGHRRILVTFSPSHPIAYFRRVPFLVHDQDPLHLDLIGTAHDDQSEPPPLKLSHVQRYRVLRHRGLTVLDPECLTKMLEARKLAIDAEGYLDHVATSFATPTPPPPPPIPAMDAFIRDGFSAPLPVDGAGSHDADHVSLDTDAIDFGEALPHRSAPPKDLTVTNGTKGKMTVCWEYDSNGNFSVEPKSIDILPGRAYQFQVIFTPGGANKFFRAQVEAYAFFKCLRDHRNIEDASQLPPWCLTATLTGHTFADSNTAAFIPAVSFLTGSGGSKLTLPPTLTGVPSFATVVLANQSDSPSAFALQAGASESEKRLFVVKPNNGVIAPREKKVLILMFTPDRQSEVRSELKMVQNMDADRYSKTLKILASGESPHAVAPVDKSGVVYFGTTCVGTSSERTYSLQNQSRLPVNFNWVIPKIHKDMLKIDPAAGIILPNQILRQTWTFAPEAIEKYVLKPYLWTSPVSIQRLPPGLTPQKMTRAHPVRAVGEGSLGRIVVDADAHELGNVIVGSVRNHDFYVYNDGQCEINFALNITETSESLLDVFPNERTEDDSNPAATLEPSGGSLPARTWLLVRVSVKPMQRKAYSFAVTHRVLAPDGTPIVEAAETEENSRLCAVSFSGVFPLLTVTDAQCHGSAMALNKKHIWEMFHVDDLNNFLDSDPTSLELVYSRITRHSIKHPPAVHTPAQVEFNFVAAPLGSPPAVVHLLFENPGPVRCDWAFLYPKELKLEIARWAENGNLDTSELEAMLVTDNDLFNVHPKSGSLESGQCVTVTCTFKHEVVGSIRLPILLKLMRGREVLLNFVGTTTSAGQPYLHFHSDRFEFTNVPVGETQTAIQIYELYNGGSVPVRFEIDTKPLFELQMQNFNSPVMECLKPKDVVPPGRFGTVLFKFSPLEAKVYSVDLDIKTNGVVTKTVTFKGEGFDKRHMGPTLPITDNSDAMGLPNTQAIPRPDQFVFMSEERISFGNIPLFSLKRKLLHLSNKSPNHVATFKWHVTQPRDLDVLEIEPVSGTLKPGEFCKVKFTFVARGNPSFYDLDVICEIVDETLLGRHRRELADWTLELERQQTEFLINEEHSDADVALERRPPSAPRLTDLKHPGAKAALGSLAASAQGTESKFSTGAELTRYKTLPPIIGGTKASAPRPPGDRERVNQARLKNTIKKEPVRWEKPIPPSPFLMHLGILARTHSLEEYRTYFPEQYPDFHINQDLQEVPVESVFEPDTSHVGPSSREELSTKSERPSREGFEDGGTAAAATTWAGGVSAVGKDDEEGSFKALKCNSTFESEVITGVLQNLLRNLVEDDTFLLQSRKVESEALPYFSQYIQNVKIDTADDHNQPPDASRAGGATSTEGVTVVGENGVPMGLTTAAQTRTTESTTSEVQHHKMPHWSLSTPVLDEEARVAESSSPAPPTSGVPRQHHPRSTTFSSPAVPPSTSSPGRPVTGGTERKPYHYSESEVTERFVAEGELKRRTRMKRMAEVGASLEGVLENLVSNILVEAFAHETSLTARPMRIAEGVPEVKAPALSASGYETNEPSSAEKPSDPPQQKSSKSAPSPSSANVANTIGPKSSISKIATT